MTTTTTAKLTKRQIADLDAAAVRIPLARVTGLLRLMAGAYIRETGKPYRCMYDNRPTIVTAR